MTVDIYNLPVEKVKQLDQKFDLIYADPPFGLQRDFKMQESDGSVKGFSDSWESFESYLDWYRRRRRRRRRKKEEE